MYKIAAIVLERSKNVICNPTLYIISSRARVRKRCRFVYRSNNNKFADVATGALPQSLPSGRQLPVTEAAARS